jgi:hypothetical protein
MCINLGGGSSWEMPIWKIEKEMVLRETGCEVGGR